MKDLTAKNFIKELTLLKSPAELKNVERFFRDNKPGNKFMGIRMSDVFALAKKFIDMPIDEVDKLLQSEFYEVRLGAVSIMDFQARNKKITEAQKRELFDLFIKRHDKN